MLVKLYNLPPSFRYADIKKLIYSECGASEIILDNLTLDNNDRKRVTIGVAEEEDAAMLMRKINGLMVQGHTITVDIVGNKQPEVRAKSNVNQPQQSMDYQSYQSTVNQASSLPLISYPNLYGMGKDTHGNYYLQPQTPSSSAPFGNVTQQYSALGFFDQNQQNQATTSPWANPNKWTANEQFPQQNTNNWGNTNAPSVIKNSRQNKPSRWDSNDHGSNDFNSGFDNNGRDLNRSGNRDYDRANDRDYGQDYNRDKDRNYGRSNDRSFDHASDSSFGHSKDSSFGRPNDNSFGRPNDNYFSRPNDNDRNYRGDRDYKHGIKDRGDFNVRERNYDRDQSRRNDYVGERNNRNRDQFTNERSDNSRHDPSQIYGVHVAARSAHDIHGNDSQQRRFNEDPKAPSDDWRNRKFDGNTPTNKRKRQNFDSELPRPDMELGNNRYFQNKAPGRNETSFDNRAPFQKRGKFDVPSQKQDRFQAPFQKPGILQTPLQKPGPSQAPFPKPDKFQTPFQNAGNNQTPFKNPFKFQASFHNPGKSQTNFQKPGNNQQKPGYNLQKPGNNQQKPSNNQQKPGNNQQKPGNNQQKPGNYQQKPGSYQQKPGNYLQKPGPAKKKKFYTMDDLNNEQLKDLDKKRAISWRYQIAATICNDMLKKCGPNMSTDFKQALKFAILDRLNRMFGDETRVRMLDMATKYREKYKIGTDAEFVKEVTQTVAKIEAQIKAEEIAAGRHPDQNLPLPAGTPSEVIKRISEKLPKYPMADKRFAKLLKKDNKVIFENENTLISQLSPKIQEALHNEFDNMCRTIVKNCTESKDFKHDRQTLDNILSELKKYLKINAAKRLLPAGPIVLRVFANPKQIKPAQLASILKNYGVCSLRKTEKKGTVTYIATCATYAQHDKLCTMEPLVKHDTKILIKPFQLLGKYRPKKIELDHHRESEYRNRMIRAARHGSQPCMALLPMNSDDDEEDEIKFVDDTDLITIKDEVDDVNQEADDSKNNQNTQVNIIKEIDLKQEIKKQDTTLEEIDFSADVATDNFESTTATDEGQEKLEDVNQEKTDDVDREKTVDVDQEKREDVDQGKTDDVDQENTAVFSTTRFYEEIDFADVDDNDLEDY